MEKQRILLADSSSLFRNALIELLNGTKDETHPNEFEIVQSVSNGAELVKVCASESFDLVLMDPDLLGMNGYEAARTILSLHPELKIIVFSMRNSLISLRKSLDIGIHGHLSKDCTIENVREGIKTVLAGKKLFDSDLMLKLLEQEKSSDKSKIITKQEFLLLKLVCEDKTTAQIARSLGLAVRTIDNKLNALFKKTRTRSKTGLAVYALRNGIV